MSRNARILFGLVLVVGGVVLVLSPLAVAEALARPHATQPEQINLRATFGGTVLGVGAFVTWLPALRPWGRALAGLIGWSMAGIGAARALGFILDGGPDTLQWAWLTAEVVIAAACAAYVARAAKKAAAQQVPGTATPDGASPP